MAQVINTNVASLTAQRNLNSSQSSLQTSLQRLSSGLRINSAKDDAAGLAISERFTTQVRGMDVAMRNANDGISLAQTAEGAMAEIGNNLQRIRELAVQSSNATNSKSDREALQAEVSELIDEIDRVAKHTDFNGTKLLDGSFSGALFQVGANAGQAISIDSTVDAQAEALGGAYFATSTFTVVAPNDDADGITISGGIKIGDVEINAEDIVISSTGDADETQKAAAEALVAAINAKVGETGVYAELDDADSPTAGQINLTSVKNSVDEDGAAQALPTLTGETDVVTAGTPEAPTEQKYTSDINIESVKGAQQAISIIDEALTQVNSARAEMGAVQNRFESVITNLSTSSENLSASRSRIMDADFAKETANLTRGQILQQAGTAMLSQANSLPQNVLSLLG